MHFKISAYNDRLVLLLLGKTCSYGSRVSQFLELGVSEFWQLLLTHMLSIESILRFCHRIAKGGDYKVEFIQSCLDLFRTKFACNLAIRYLVFRWDLCKGCV